MWISSGVELQAHHFVAYLHRARRIPPRLRVEIAPSCQVLIELSRKRVSTDPRVSAGERHGPVVAVHALIGEDLEHGERMHIGTMPTIREPDCSLVRLEPFTEPAMCWIELIVGSPGVDPLLGAVGNREFDAGDVTARPLSADKTGFRSILSSAAR